MKPLSQASIALVIPWLAGWLADTRGAVAADPQNVPALTAKDREFLAGLVKQFLFDPKGAQRVRVQTIRRTAWRTAQEALREGWLVAGAKDQPDRVYFTDGESIPAPGAKALTWIDFEAACQARLPAKEKVRAEADNSKEVFRRMRATAVGAVEESDLVLAAWLHRGG
jgi:hypothetical protein